ncbi:MAG: exo-alpha-sialidase [Lentisphaerae bacterium]|nr:exo-alpha-sialidase [Lentisphaerota bacterium]MBT4815831.1 exo-alpha-sialidase [Lentisphaerota bacterium]MBT5605140.1 exo-alpha-sialidase [Lentisphaerota bacterium]MBT7840245.1 exo-alpha-sialidase [Lentisphaerota bacterium]
MHYEVPTDQTNATIEDISVICKQEGRYIGWPTVCLRRDGELLAAFSGDRDQHVCPWGKVQLVRSADDGKTWTDPVSICNTPLDDRDAGIIETKEGTLVVAWFTSLAFEGSMKSSWLKNLEGDAVLNQWRLHAEKLTPEIRQQWLGYWTRRSEDGGKTWDAPVKTKGSAPHGAIQLEDGRLLYVGRRFPHKNTELTVEESRDDGRSWQQIASIQASPGDAITGFHEPHVVEAADGALIAQFRYHWSDPKTRKRDGRKDYLRQAISTDGGKTWTPAVATPLLGYPPHLIRLKNDAIVTVYGRRLAPYGEYACVSWDNGRTWDVDNEIKLAGAMSGDLGYPASTQLADGSILTVYYQIHESGEKTCLMGTRWRLKDR